MRKKNTQLNTNIQPLCLSNIDELKVIEAGGNFVILLEMPLCKNVKELATNKTKNSRQAETICAKRILFKHIICGIWQ